MFKHPTIVKRRARVVLDSYLLPAIYPRTSPLDVSALHLDGEPIAREEVDTSGFHPFNLDDEWGPAWGTTWFRMQGSIPGEWRGSEVVALINIGYSGWAGFGAEALLWGDDGPLQGISPNHFECRVAKKARGKEPVSLLVEAAANPPVTYGGRREWPLLMPEAGSPKLFKLARAELAVADRDVEAFYFDYKVLVEMAENLSEESPLYGDVLYALNKAAGLLDLGNLAESIPAARPVLEEVLRRPSRGTDHHITAVGHAHIDTAWLWPLRETVRKCARSFSTVIGLMDEYPEFQFICSQAQQYAWMRDNYQSLFERIREKVKQGRFEPVGSMWIEADCNVTSGESLVRQILHGKNFFMDEFGYEPVDIFLPDTFGFGANLPQIFRKSGAHYFLTQKMSWNLYNKFPHHSFMWEGLDGSQIFSHFPPANTYNATFSVKELLFDVSNFKDHGLAHDSLYIFGFGDGGGGPTREMLESARRVSDLEGLPRVQMGKAAEFFQRAEQNSRDLAVWHGELYLENHRAVYTTQATTKKGNRKSELLLRDAELWSSCRLEPWPSYPQEALDESWKTVLLYQFHDILPGSSIHWVYEETKQGYARVAERVGAEVDYALTDLSSEIDTTGLKRPLAIFNSCSHARKEVVRVEEDAYVMAEVPPMGYTAIDLAAPVLHDDPVDGDETFLENQRLRVEFDEHGLIKSIFDKYLGRDAVPPNAVANVFQLHHDYPITADAWDVDLYYRDRFEDLTEVDEISMVDKHPLKASVRMTRTFGDSKVDQLISLTAGSSRLTFDTIVDWNENHRFLKVAFPVQVRSGKATHEVQFGHVERPTHYSTSWDMAKFETCCQKWFDLSEPGFGVALLNDSKYGNDVFGNVMRISLLRAPGWPDPKADRGRHEFSYALVTHAGDPRAGGVIEEAYAFNIPLRTRRIDRQTGSLPQTHSFFSVSRPGVVVEAVKKAEREDALIVRLYEAFGGRGPALLTTSLPVTGAWHCDLMERNAEQVSVIDGAIDIDFKPFEIVTLKLYL